MKKSLLALAVLGAFAGTASAQSSVTIYGIIDVGIHKTNSGTSSFGPASLYGANNVWNVRANTSSRLGFKGTEDLGGGMKANFLIEHRLDPSEGTDEKGAVGMWHASSWVSLSGGFGEVRLGRQYTPIFYTGLASDPFGYDYSVAGAAGFTRGGAPSRANNAVTYLSPNFAGFTGQVQVAAGEGQPASAATGNLGGRNVGFNVAYNAGPLLVGFGFNDTDVTAAKATSWELMGAYDLGVVRPIVSYSEGKFGPTGAEVKTKQYLLGATAPMGPGRLKAVVARNDPQGPNNNTTKFGVGYAYDLSKRTSLYGDLGTVKTDALTRTTGFQLGVKHVF